MEEDTGNRW